MARPVKEQEYRVKRGAILDTARRLVQTKGYEQMAIQDVLDDLQISKGAFYHYFGSKQALLEALIEQMLDEGEQLLIAITHDPTLSALEKLQCFLIQLAQWKTAQKETFLGFLRVWYADENALVRHKLQEARIKRVTPWLAAVIRQGTQEGTLTADYPDEVGQVVVSLLSDHSNTLAELLLSGQFGPEQFGYIERMVTAYTEALERVLGAPGHSLQLVDVAALKAWFCSTQNPT
ncbi:MAG: TetR/AcrR family transcriptional regulator [Ktedonobacteraceae bacterium]|nr:TetR/AcrR family transcriptional regulator [Ktedonobacteraceae bacterium]